MSLKKSKHKINPTKNADNIGVFSSLETRQKNTKTKNTQELNSVGIFFAIEKQFSSAHFYRQNSWDSKQNEKVFGRCFTDFGHGHNYKVRFEINYNKNSLSFSDFFKKCDLDIQLRIQKLDHEHLNFKIPKFKTTVPTTENIMNYLIEELSDVDFFKNIKSIELYEMEDLWTRMDLIK